MIEPTDEMVEAWRDAMKAAAEEAVQSGAPLGKTKEIARAGLAAVLAIVERDYAQAGPCSAVLPHIVDDTGIWCELRHGHSGDHEAGITRWKERT